MEPYCQNPYCQKESVKEVPVSVTKSSGQQRSLCSACEEAYTWGLQHGKMLSAKRQVWVLAVTDRRIIVHVNAFNSKEQAEKALFEYLRSYENYNGPDDISHACDWLAEHNERPSVDLCSTPVNPS